MYDRVIGRTEGREESERALAIERVRRAYGEGNGAGMEMQEEAVVSRNDRRQARIGHTLRAVCRDPPVVNLESERSTPNKYAGYEKHWKSSPACGRSCYPSAV